MVANREISGELIQAGQEIERIIAHHIPPLVMGRRRIRKSLHETPDKTAVVILELGGDVLDFVMRVERHLALGGLLLSNRRTADVVIAALVRGINSVQPVATFLAVVDRTHAAQHLVERVVLQHQYDNVLDLIDCRHASPLPQPIASRSVTAVHHRVLIASSAIGSYVGPPLSDWRGSRARCAGRPISVPK